MITTNPMGNAPTHQHPLGQPRLASPRVPLLCWDIAHPDLPKRQHLAEDMGQFDALIREYNWVINRSIRSLLADDATLIVTDRTSRIRWVSHGFRKLTGYEPEEVLGETPALFQGKETSEQTRVRIREKLACAEAVAFRIKNYRKGGLPYWCQIEIMPLYNPAGECTHFLAIEYETN